MVLSIIFLEDKHNILLHLSIFYEYQQFFQHRICFSIPPQLQLVNLHRNRRYFVIKLHTWFCLSYFLKTSITIYCIYQYFMNINSFFNTVSVSRYSRTIIISLRLGFRRNFLSVLHPNLVSSPIKGILEILNLTTRCIPMDILAWTDCVRSSAGKIS